MSRIMFSAAFVLCICPAAHSQSVYVGHVPVDGRSMPVAAEVRSGEAIVKTVQFDDGTSRDLREIRAQEIQRTRQAHGKRGILLDRKLAAAGPDQKFEVLVRFAPDQRLKDLLNSPVKTDPSIVRQRRAQMYEAQLGALESLLATRIEPFPSSNPAHAELVTILTKSAILRLDSLKSVSSISLTDGSVPISGNMSVAFGSGSGAGLDMAGFTNHGAGATGGNVDPDPIDADRVSSDLYDVPLTIRSGSSGSTAHGALTTAMIRNSTGSTANFTKGGAYTVDRIYYSRIPRDAQNNWPLDSIRAAYQWCISNGASVINSSWGILRWKGGYSDSLANKLDYYYDLWANEDYIMNVVSAGNSGAGSAEWADCKTTYYPGWDTANCVRCMKYGHNILAVGNLNDASNSQYTLNSSSSWKNGPTSDESPHVVANGTTVGFPWGYSGTGTSFSAAAVSSFALSLISTRSGLYWYPELQKAITMVSAVANPSPENPRWTSSSTDKNAGMGLPSGTYGAKIATNTQFGRPSGDTILAKPYGAVNFYFSSGATYGDSVHYFLKVDTTANVNMHFLTTWMSNPDHANLGGTILNDDIDFYVYRDGSTVVSGYSAPHTTEYGATTHPGGLKVYRVKVQIYSRASTSNHPIYGGIAWAPSN